MTLIELNRWCCALPGVEVRYPFGDAPGVRTWCVNKKMFAWVNETAEEQRVQLKADPELIPSLIAGYAAIFPGYHMNKRHWITVQMEDCDDAMLRGLLEDAHQLVVAGLPEKQRIGLLRD